MNARLYAIYATDPDNSILHQTISILPNKVREKILKFHHLADRWRSLISNLLVREMLSKELGIPLDSVDIEFNRHGKPFLANMKRHFNLSYSKNLVVLATDDHPIGVDVEYIQPLSDLEELIGQFSDEEQKAFRMQPEKNRMDYFYDLWTLKESYIKALGVGLSCPLQSFNIRIEKKNAFLIKGIDLNNVWHFKRYTIDHQYKCSVCAVHTQFPKSVILVKQEELF